MRRGTNRMEWPYRGPEPEPREVRAPHRPGEGERARTPRERERKHTPRAGGEYQKGNRTKPAEGTDCMEWRTAEEGKEHPDATTRHTQRGERGAGGGEQQRHKNQHRPQPPQPAASAAHTRTGHCTRQGSSGAPSHAPAPRLGSLRASPWGSQWRRASSTGPASPAPRGTTH